jgi:hypothetical protein
MHRKYGSQGLVCLSASLDETDHHAKAVEFLKKVEAEFANFRLDEEQEFWQAKFKIVAPPAVFVFDRQGRRAARFNSEDPDRPFTYADVDKLVQELLRQAP